MLLSQNLNENILNRSKLWVNSHIYKLWRKMIYRHPFGCTHTKWERNRTKNNKYDKWYDVTIK